MRDPHNPERWLSGQEIRDFRQRLFDAQDGLCHWCKKPMRLVQPCPPSQNIGDVATFEHLKDRLSKGGRQGHNGSIVCACSTCNNTRNKQRAKLVLEAVKEHFGPEHHKFRRGKSIADMVEELHTLGINPLGE